MRNTDPLDFFTNHRDTILRWGGISAAVLILFLIIRSIAMRFGGWKAASRRLGREIALTAYAFGAPMRTWLRYRRSVRLLVARLGASTTWRDAERALVAAKFAAAPGQPYAAVVGDDTVTVLFAAADMPPPSGLWQPVPDDPWAWTASRAQLPSVTPDAEGSRPVVVALGERDRDCVFLDLVVGPPMVCVQGDPRSGPALFQAVAAQLDARLPGGQVVVADGVHRDVPGPPVRDAYRTARATPPRLGLPVFLATPELPDPLPPELAEPQGDSPSLRVLLGGPGRSHVRTLSTDVHGRVGVPGTPLVVSCNALGAALARVLPTVPPVLPPVPAPVSRAGAGHAEWFVEEESGTAVAEPQAARTTTADPVTTLEPAGTMASAVSARTAVAEPPARSSGGQAAPGTSRPAAWSTRPASPVANTGPEPAPSVGEPAAGTPARTSTATVSATLTSDHEPPFSPAVSARGNPTSEREPKPPTPNDGPEQAPVPDPTPEPDPTPQPEPTPQPDPTPQPEPTPEPEPTHDPGPEPTPDPEPTREPDAANHPTAGPQPPSPPAPPS
ncbi:hypothetical protein OG948_51270 (plasmid) [Embleya sp. NBC_00888]|uniref:hypothetical protein n=1 Tax=Embleya sp. NBC_00888 TaxID=2975960 RepID=UPI002F90BFA3|nr:hypothetical protein OG948_51270 [Embleya sp. NBC_00888]